MIMNIIILLLMIGILIELNSIKTKIYSVIQEIGDIRVDLVKLKKQVEDLEEGMYF